MYICVVCVWVCVCNSLVAQMVKNPPAMQETWVRSLGREDPRRRKRQPILAWRIPWTEEANGLQSMGRKESDTTEWLTLSHIYTHTHTYIYDTKTNKKMETSIDSFNSSLFLQAFYCLAVPPVLPNLSSWTRDWTQTAAVTVQSPNHYIAGEFPLKSWKKRTFLSLKYSWFAMC